MTATVQAVCPGCRNVLRIPLDWAERAMKCKKCGMLVQGRKKPDPTAETVPAQPTVTPPVLPVPAAAVPPQAMPAPMAYPPAPQPAAYPHPYPQQGYPQPYPHAPQGYPQPYAYQPPPYAHDPQGYPPQPYPYPPQPYPQPYGEYAPQPYGYPQPAYPPPAPAAHVPTPADVAFNADFKPSARTGYRRKAGNRWIGPAVVLVLCGSLVAGGIYFMKKMERDEGRQNQQAKALNEGKTGPTPPPDHKVTPAAPVLVGDPFPRRMLFVHISKYIYFNSLTPGAGGRGDDLPTKTARKLAFEWRVPADKANNQLFVLSDTSGDKDFRPPIKSVLEKAIADFCGTSREQDRVVFYFGGHAVEIDGKAYLAPVEGEPDAAATLLPLDDVFAKLKECKAQQKVLLLDVCRLNTQAGAAKPGSEPMGEKLDQLLHAAPEGVQVVTSCAAGENAYEIQETGSEFLAAFRTQAEKLKAAKPPAPAPADPLPVGPWVDAVRAYLSTKRDNRAPQTVKPAGGEAGKKVEYNKDEPLPPHFAWAEVPKGVSAEDVARMVQSANLPGIRKDQEMPASLGQVYPFDAEAMKAYADDGIADDQLRKEPEKYPLRFATLDALQAIREKWTFGDDGLKETFDGGSVDDKAKKDALADQNGPALIELELKEKLFALDKVADKVKDEKSKRWVALYQYARAQTQFRWAFIEEYRGALGKIRTDNLPKPEKGKAAGYRLASAAKMTSKKDIVEKADEARETLAKMAVEHKGTPWEVLAKMNKNIALGLKWEVIAEEAKEEGAEMKPDMKSDTKPETVAGAPIPFEKVQAVLRTHCVSCHGNPVVRAKIDVRTLDSIKAKDGLVVFGDPAKSDLWGAINADSMPPPDKPRMTADEKQLIKDWITRGAK